MKLLKYSLLIIFILINTKGITQISDSKKDTSLVKNYSLLEAQNYAIENSYESKNTYQDITIAKKKIWETTAIGLPQVNASVEYKHMLEVPTQLMPDFISPAVVGTNVRYGLLTPNYLDSVASDSKFPVQMGSKHDMTWGVTATQLLFSGEYIVALQASKIYLSLSEQQHEITKQKVKENIAKSYYLVLIALESRRILRSNKTNIDSILYESNELYKAGLIEETDVDQLKLTAKSIENALNSFNKQVEISYRLLKFQMGMDFNEKIILSDSLKTIIKLLDFDVLNNQKFDININADYKLMQIQEGLSSLNLKRERSTYLPSLTAYFSYSKNAQRNEFSFFDSDKDWYPTAVIGVKLEIPLFSSGMRHSKIQQKKLEFSKVKTIKKQLEQSLYLKVEQLKSNLTNSLATFNNQKESLTLAQKINNKTYTKYKTGVSSSIDLMQAQNQYLTAQSNYFQALLELLNIKAELDNILNN